MENGPALAHLLLKGDQDASWDFLLSLKEHEDSLFIYESIITVAMQHIGYLWETNKITVADEHLATTTCDFLLSRYMLAKKRKQHAPLQTKKAMFLCLESEQHYLGIKMTSQLFAEAGWEIRFHGPNLPLEYAKKAAREWQPDVICLSFSILYHAEQLGPYISELEKLPARPTVMVGGRLVEKYEFTRHGSEKTVFMKNLEDVKNWLGRHPEGVKSSVGY